MEITGRMTSNLTWIHIEISFMFENARFAVLVEEFGEIEAETYSPVRHGIQMLHLPCSPLIRLFVMEF